jgi:hypothetical protein
MNADHRINEAFVRSAFIRVYLRLNIVFPLFDLTGHTNGPPYSRRRCAPGLPMAQHFSVEVHFRSAGVARIFRSGAHFPICARYTKWRALRSANPRVMCPPKSVPRVARRF